MTAHVRDKNRQRLIDALLASNLAVVSAALSRGIKGDGTIEQVIHYHYPSPNDIDQILSLNNFRDFGGGNIYNASFGFLDQNPHNTMHIWTGGQNPDAGADSGSWRQRGRRTQRGKHGRGIGGSAERRGARGRAGISQEVRPVHAAEHWETCSAT